MTPAPCLYLRITFVQLRRQATATVISNCYTSDAVVALAAHDQISKAAHPANFYSVFLSLFSFSFPSVGCQHGTAFILCNKVPIDRLYSSFPLLCPVIIPALQPRYVRSAARSPDSFHTTHLTILFPLFRLWCCGAKFTTPALMPQITACTLQTSSQSGGKFHAHFCLFGLVNANSASFHLHQTSLRSLGGSFKRNHRCIEHDWGRGRCLAGQNQLPAQPVRHFHLTFRRRLGLQIKKPGLNCEETQRRLQREWKSVCGSATLSCTPLQKTTLNSGEWLSTFSSTFHRVLLQSYYESAVLFFLFYCAAIQAVEMVERGACRDPSTLTIRPRHDPHIARSSTSPW